MSKYSLRLKQRCWQLAFGSMLPQTEAGHQWLEKDASAQRFSYSNRSSHYPLPWSVSPGSKHLYQTRTSSGALRAIPKTRMASLQMTPSSCFQDVCKHMTHGACICDCLFPEATHKTVKVCTSTRPMSPNKDKLPILAALWGWSSRVRPASLQARLLLC